MIVDTKYMHRCIQLATKGRGYTSPNPMVGAVIVYDDMIIGEGYHQKYGYAHAEVNAINSVKDKSLLPKSTIYVSLEPCSHQGKTPPCAQLIIDSQIPRVIIGCLDPFPEVSGRGVKMLNDAGIKTRVGLLEKECLELNKEFNTVYTKDRPYIYLKWAQSKDGYIDKERTNEQAESAIISNDFTKILVHKLRAETSAIMVGTNTAIADNPSLTTRLWYGNNPTRLILDRSLRIPNDSEIFNGEVETLIFTESKDLPKNTNNLEYVHIDFDDQMLSVIFTKLKEKHINSIMIEGGSKFLQYVIDTQMWDEASVEVSNENFEAGTVAPHINGIIVNEKKWKESKHMNFVPRQV